MFEELVRDKVETNSNVQLTRLGSDSEVSEPCLHTTESPTISPRVPPVPTSSFQFQADWKALKSSTDKFYQYFKVRRN